MGYQFWLSRNGVYHVSRDGRAVCGSTMHVERTVENGELSVQEFSRLCRNCRRCVTIVFTSNGMYATDLMGGVLHGTS